MVRRVTGALIFVALAVGMAVSFAGVSGAAVTPQIVSLYPGEGPPGTPVSIRGTGFGTAAGEVSFNGLPAAVFLWTPENILVTVPEGATTGPVMVTNPAGTSNGYAFTVTTLPGPAQRWYLAEGSTAWGFETFVVMENTTALDATVNLTYNTPEYGRLPRPLPLNVPPNSRVTLNVGDDLALPLDFSTELTSSQPIVCERAMYWGGRKEGTGSVGVTKRSLLWYFAEGSTWWPYETWLCIQNPSVLSPATVDITYMTSKGVIEKGAFQVGAGQRKSIDISKDVGQCEVSARVASNQPIVCERSMYWNERRGGHNSIGAPAPSAEWYMAEGSTAWGFTTWLCIQNPDPGVARCDVTYMTPGGPVVLPAMSLPANSRTTVRVNDHVKNADTSIRVSSDRPLVAERTMYWDNGTGMAGHGTIGMTAPADEIYLAEGTSAWGFDTYICIQNPDDQAAEVEVTYLTNTGPVDTPPRAVAPKSRMTIRMADELAGRDASVRIRSSRPVMAERAVYWNARGGGHCSIGWAPRD